MVDDYAAFCSWCGRPFPKDTIKGLEPENESKNIVPPPFNEVVEGEEDMPPPIPDDWDDDCGMEIDEELPPPLPDIIVDEVNDGVVLPPPYFDEENKKIVPPPYMGN